MNHPHPLERTLQDILATETRGLAQHLLQSRPHVDFETRPVIPVVRKVAQVNRDHARRLFQLMDRLEIDPPAASFGVDVARAHYLSLETVLPHLVRQQRRQVDMYRQALDAITRPPDVVHELQALLEENRRLVDELEQAAARAGVATD